MKTRHFVMTLIAASTFCTIPAFADEADDMMKAIEKTQQDLRNSSTRNAMTKDSAEATKVAHEVKSMSGNSANEQGMYDLAADVLGNMKGLSQDQIMQVMEQAQKDPEGFVKSWSPAQRKQLEQLADRMPAASKGKQP